MKCGRTHSEGSPTKRLMRSHENRFQEGRLPKREVFAERRISYKLLVACAQPSTSIQSLIARNHALLSLVCTDSCIVATRLQTKEDGNTMEHVQDDLSAQMHTHVATVVAKIVWRV